MEVRKNWEKMATTVANVFKDKPFFTSKHSITVLLVRPFILLVIR